MAVLDALRQLAGSVTVHSDSTYVVNCFNDRWYEGWLARGWKNANKKPVANRDLWEPLIDLFKAREEELAFVWVKGHSGDRMNDLVDAMAVAEVEKLKAETSAAAPTPPSAEQLAAIPWPSEQAIAVVGTTSPSDELVEELLGAVEGLDKSNDIVISGLRRGSELTAAESALEVGVPLGVVLPFEDPAGGWPNADKERFDRCVSSAQWTIVLDGDQRKPQTAVRDRNLWLWRAVVGAIVVDDSALVDEAEEHGLGVIVIDSDHLL